MFYFVFRSFLIGFSKWRKQLITNNRDDYVIFVLVYGVVNIPMKCGIISVYFRTFAVYYSILNMISMKTSHLLQEEINATLMCHL